MTNGQFDTRLVVSVNLDVFFKNSVDIFDLVHHLVALVALQLARICH